MIEKYNKLEALASTANKLNEVIDWINKHEDDEEDLELNDETEKLLINRIEEVARGRNISTEELIKRIKKHSHKKV